jgi:hypothetical protein
VPRYAVSACKTCVWLQEALGAQEWATRSTGLGASEHSEVARYAVSACGPVSGCKGTGLAQTIRQHL